MDIINFERALRMLCQAQPFITFVIELTSGAQVTISDPSAVSSSNGLIEVKHAKGRQFFECSSVCQLHSLPLPDVQLDLYDDIPF
jgi:hypothetical protein